MSIGNLVIWSFGHLGRLLGLKNWTYNRAVGRLLNYQFTNPPNQHTFR
jgi:hypothetical protein